MKTHLVDLQVNGWMGTDFTSEDLTVDQVSEVTRQLVTRGTAAYCPTVVTAASGVLQHSLRTIAEAMKDPEIGGRILGIHLEGPFINPEHGAIGAHPPEHAIDPDIRAFDQFQEWASGSMKILTLSPELPGAEDLIRHAVTGGVTVSVGHHLAKDEDLDRAVKAGATLATHVGNGIPNEIHRHDNPLWWTLACDDVSGMFITDGHHLPSDFIKAALRAKTVDRFIVTSDASSLAGLPPGKYTMSGRLPVVIGDDGLIYSEQSEGLAGSHSTMVECMNHLAGLGLLTETELRQVGFLNPLRAIGLSPEDLETGGMPEVAFEGGEFVISPSKL